jgi:hypothetical protein
MTYVGKPSTSGTSLSWDGDSFIFSTVSGESGGASGFSNFIYMDVNGNDSTGQRGDASKPFLTLQAAVNEMQNGDVILIGPGEFQINTNIATPFSWPANTSITSITIIGSGISTDYNSINSPRKAGTLIKANIANGTTLSPNVMFPIISPSSPNNRTISGFRIENLSVRPTTSGGGSNIHVFRCYNTNYSLSDSGDRYMYGDGLVMKNISVEGLGLTSLIADRVNQYNIDSVVFAGSVDLTNCRLLVLSSIRNVIGGAFTVRGNRSAPVPVLIDGARNRYMFNSCDLSGITIGGDAEVYIDKQCRLSSGLGGTALQKNGIFVPSIQFYGIAESVNFTGPTNGIPQLNNNEMTIDFSGASIRTLSIGCNSGVTSRQRVKADGLLFGGESQVDGAITLDSGIDYYDKYLDAANGTIRIFNSYPTAGGPTVTPRSWSGTATLGGTGTDNISFLNTDKFNNSYYITGTSPPNVVHVAGSSTSQGVLAISGRSTTTVTVQSSNASGTAYITAFWTGSLDPVPSF